MKVSSYQLDYHLGFTQEELNSQYDLSVSRPNYQTTVIPNWENESKKIRANVNCRLNISYGEKNSQKYDMFFCNERDAPTVIYFHGGYWQRGDKSVYSFLAKSFIHANLNLIVVGYSLCPAVTITMISEEAREALAHIWITSDTLGINKNRLAIIGHSAGGYIALMMMGTEWSQLKKGLPNNLLKCAIPISPISFLEPIRLVTSINTALGITEAEAFAESPIISHPPISLAPQMIAVGEAETDEFRRQAIMYVECFGQRNNRITPYIVREADHFEIINMLSDINSHFFAKTIELIKGT